MALVAITGLEIVIIYIQTFDGSIIIGTLFATSIVKFLGVIWWFMHLKWDKLINTGLFVLGLVITLGTFFAIIYMADTHPEITKFEVKAINNEWQPSIEYDKNDYVVYDGSYFVAKLKHKSTDTFTGSIDGSGNEWTKIEQNQIPHQFSWVVSHGDLIEIHSQKDGLSFFKRVLDSEQEDITGEKVYLLDQEASTDDFRIKVKSEAYWTETVSKP